MINNTCRKQQSFIPQMGRSLRDLNRFSKGFTALASEQIGLFVDRTLNLAEATILPSFSMPLGVCDFPEQVSCCPEPCTLMREVFPGETVVEPVLVRNNGKGEKQFVFEPCPLKDAKMNEAGRPEVTPGSVTLQPGDAALVRISYKTDNLGIGRRYNSDVKVKGHCEQTIRLIVHVTSPDAARCTIAQKETVKARRHDWRDHFYCEPEEPARETAAGGKKGDVLKTAASGRNKKK